MADDHVDFDFALSFGRSIPDYAWREGPWRGRATRAAIELSHGKIPDGTTIIEAFQAASTSIRICAADKVIAAEGQIEEPVLVDAADLMG